MRSQDNKSKRQQHIIDIDFYNSPIDIDYIISIKHNIKTVLNSVDTSILYRDLYDENFGISGKTLEDRLIGPVLYREQESIDGFTSYETLIEIYLLRDIKKFFGYTLDEFLNLSRYARMIVIEQAEKHMKRLSEQMQALNENADASNINTDELNELLIGE